MSLIKEKMITHEEITVTKYETEFVAKHKDFDVIGVGGNEFEAVLELSKALGALIFSKEAEHKALKKDVVRYFELFINRKRTIQESTELLDLFVKLSKVGKEE